MRIIKILGTIIGVLSFVSVFAQQDGIKQLQNYTLPFAEEFESGSFPPADWASYRGSNNVGTDYDWEQNSEGYSGNCAFVKWENNNPDAIGEDWLVTPQIDLGLNSFLSFYEHLTYADASWVSDYYIKISTTSQTDYSSFSTLVHYTQMDISKDYTLREIDLSAYNGQSVYIAFVMTNDDGDDWYVDNITIEEESGGGTAGGKLLISEVAYPKGDSSARFVELYNSGDVTIDLADYRLAFYRNTRWVELSGTIAAGDTYIFAPHSTNFNNAYGFQPDYANDSHFKDKWFNGKDAVILLHKKANGGYARFDTYGVAKTDGSGKAWEYTDKHAVRKAYIIDDHNPYIESEWVISTAFASPYFDVTPGNHNETYYWNASTNNEWDEHSNWTVNGGRSTIPDAAANVLIRSDVAVQPEKAKYRFPYFFNSLNLPSGTAFTMESDNILKVIQDVIIHNNANLILKSDTHGAATFIPEGTVSGEIHVQRYFPDINDTIWHLFAPPITNLVTGVLMDQYLKEWNEPSQVWEYISETDLALTSGKGYALHLLDSYGQTIDMTGNISTGDVSTPDMRFTAGGSWEGYNLVGNPYTASVDWEIISSELGSGIDKAIYYWDVKSGQYVFYNNTDGTASRYIPSGQAFFIHITADHQQFTFTTDSRVSDSSQLYYKSGEEKTYSEYKKPSPKQQNRLVITTTNAYGKTDKAFLKFHEKATEEYDAQFDAVKFTSANSEVADVWLNYQAMAYSINTLPLEKIEGRYELVIRFGKQEDYKLSFDGMDSFDANQPIKLYDRYTNTYYNLREHKDLTFYHAADIIENRFEIIFSKAASTEMQENNQFLIFSRHGKLNIMNSISGSSSTSFSYRVYAIDGRIIAEYSDKQEVINQYFDVSPGLYLIKLGFGKQQLTQKVWLSK